MKLRLMELRKAAGYSSRDDFANAIGVNPSTYKSWETNARSIKLEDACEIADFLGCSLDEMTGRDEYVGKTTDRRLERISRAYSAMNEDGKERLDLSAGELLAVPFYQEGSKSGEDAQTLGA